MVSPLPRCILICFFGAHWEVSALPKHPSLTWYFLPPKWHQADYKDWLLISDHPFPQMQPLESPKVLFIRVSILHVLWRGPLESEALSPTEKQTQSFGTALRAAAPCRCCLLLSLHLQLLKPHRRCAFQSSASMTVSSKKIDPNRALSHWWK